MPAVDFPLVNGADLTVLAELAQPLAVGSWPSYVAAEARPPVTVTKHAAPSKTTTIRRVMLLVLLPWDSLIVFICLLLWLMSLLDTDQDERDSLRRA